MRKTKLLVVSPDFAPSALIGAKRPTKLVIRMRDYGWEPYVLTVLQQIVKDTCCSFTVLQYVATQCELAAGAARIWETSR
jgi:hypothetical protein